MSGDRNGRGDGPPAPAPSPPPAVDADLCAGLTRLVNLLRTVGPDTPQQARDLVDVMLDQARSGHPSNEDDVLQTLGHLRGLLDQLVPAPVPAPPPAAVPGPPGTGLHQIPAWIDGLADAISWLITAWAIMQAGSWVGYDNWMVALAMGAALVTLWPNLVEPFRRFIKSILLEIFQTIIDLVEAIGHFIEAASRYYNGNFARMVIEVILVPVFLRTLSTFQDYPAVKQFADFMLQAIKTARELLQQGLDAARKLVDDTRALLLGKLDDLLAFLPEELGRWRTSIEADFNRAFTQALNRLDALDSRVDRAVAGLGSFITVTIAGVTTRIDVLEAGLHDRIAALIDDTAGAVARRYALYRLAHATAETYDETGQALAASGPPGAPPDVEAAAPWAVVAELVVELPAGPPAVPSAAYDAVQEAVSDLRAFLDGAPNPVGPWPSELTHLPTPPAEA